MWIVSPDPGDVGVGKTHPSLPDFETKAVEGFGTARVIDNKVKFIFREEDATQAGEVEVTETGNE